MRVKHAAGSYEVVVRSFEDAVKALPSETRIVSDETVYELVAGKLFDRAVRAVKPGEGSKDLATFGSLLSWLAESKASRKSTVVAVGGGVVGDLAGYVAASYMRGVRFIQIPTTLLAMVDSSVGGKVGIDLPEGKNLAGAFKAPDVVYLPVEMLRHLPLRQFRNGMAEVLKYGFIMDRELCESLAAEPLEPDSQSLSRVVLRCVELKALVVEEDEFETTGRRAILNYGHTIGHAIEHAMGYQGMLHGEAISIGMVLEARLGERLGVTPRGVAARVEQDLLRYGLPTHLENTLSAESLIDTMARDKKVESGELAFSLLTDVGRCKLVRGVDAREVGEVLSGA
jgi:3-dehydroquinate synthase